MKLKYKICLTTLLVIVIAVYLTYRRIYNCNYNSSKLIEGKKFLLNKNVAICGLVRDSGKRIKNNVYEIQKMTTYFKDYRVLIVENDSIDDTRDILLNWASVDNKVKVLGCDGINLNKCKLNLPATIYHDTSEKRIKKMSYLRNIYLNELRKPEYNNIDYVIVWDLDLVAEFNVNGIYNLGYRLLKMPNVDAICANGITGIKYYDTYALRLLDDDKNRHRKGVYDKLYMMIPYGCNVNEGTENEGLVKVKSCFGGFTIYKKSSIVASKYDTYFDDFGTSICEHEYLSENFKNVYTDSKLQFYVYEN